MLVNKSTCFFDCWIKNFFLLFENQWVCWEMGNKTLLGWCNDLVQENGIQKMILQYYTHLCMQSPFLQTVNSEAMLRSIICLQGVSVVASRIIKLPCMHADLQIIALWSWMAKGKLRQKCFLLFYAFQLNVNPPC